MPRSVITDVRKTAVDLFIAPNDDDDHHHHYDYYYYYYVYICAACVLFLADYTRL